MTSSPETADAGHARMARMREQNATAAAAAAEVCAKSATTCNSHFHSIRKVALQREWCEVLLELLQTVAAVAGSSAAGRSTWHWLVGSKMAAASRRRHVVTGSCTRTGPDELAPPGVETWPHDAVVT